MQWLGTAFNGFGIQAVDGSAGELADLLFDDKTWQVRWLVVDTGRWLQGRRLLIHPSSLQQPGGETAALTVRLSRSQLRQSPFIESDVPVSAQMERSLSSYYGHDPDAAGAWCRTNGPAAPQLAPSRPFDGSVAGMMARERPKLPEPHLRSVREVEGYLIRATNGDAGFLANVVVDDEAWCVHDMVIDVPCWLSVKHVVVPTAAVERISWAERCVRLDLTREKLKASAPLFETGMMGSPYEALLRTYHMWKTAAPVAGGGG